VTDAASIADAARQVDTLDILVNNAGISGDGTTAAGAVRLALLPDDGPSGEFFSWDGTPVPW
jgi:NAD(P)-dependent dehydrogenase (short-subunit alcohol dehydrogenase family)